MEHNIAVMEQNNNYMRNRDVGGKEQIKAMIE
jgi:hypothetical protein